MGRRCQACHGILGQDCFNEADCMQISRNNEQYEHEQRFAQEFEHYDVRNYTLKQLFKTIYWKIINDIKNNRAYKKELNKKEITVEDIPF